MNDNKNENQMDQDLESDLESTESVDTNEMADSESSPSAKLGEALKAAKEELLYLRADFDNYRKRMIREQEQKVKYANEHFVHELLTVYNNFELALSHGKQVAENPETKTFYQGVEMNYHELGQMLGRFGVEFIGSVGEDFDPTKHEAISQTPASPEMEGKLVQILRKGCLLNGRLITPAQVSVGTPIDESDQNG